MLLLCPLVIGAHDASKSYIQQIENEIHKQMKSNAVPGVAIAIVENGEVVLSKGYGLANVAERVPVTMHTIFELASISKTISAIGILRLVELGKLTLDSPATAYLKSWKFSPSNFDYEKISIRHLLNHTAGLVPTYYSGETSLDELPTLTDSLNGIKNPSDRLAVAYEPGSSFLYTGSGYTLLQLIVEEVTGIPFQEYMKREIFERIGLTSTTFDPQTLDRKRLAISYDLFGSKIKHHFYTEQAAAGLYSTASDLSVLMTYLVSLYHLPKERSEEGLISPQSLRLMMASNQNNYALGFEVEALNENRLLAFHTGDNYGMRSGLFLLPMQMDGLAILVNSDNGLELVEEIGNMWLELRTGGESLSYYKEMKKLKYWMNVICGALIVILGYFTIKMMKSLWNFSKGRKKTMEIGKIVGWLLLISGWIVIFYTPYSFFPGMTLATFLPKNLINITFVIIFFGFANIVIKLLYLTNKQRSET